jgi:hypothetical protein
VRKLTTTDEGRLQLVLEGELNDAGELEKICDLLPIQQGEVRVDIAGLQGEPAVSVHAGPPRAPAGGTVDGSPDDASRWPAAFLALTATLPAAAVQAGTCPGAERLEEALSLIAEAHPVLVAERGIYEEETRQHAWETVLTLGDSITDTFESGAAGPNAALRVRIPLWDRSTELESAQASTAWRRGEDRVRTAFLADVQALCERAAQVQALDTRRAFHRDRLTYHQGQVDQGLGERIGAAQHVVFFPLGGTGVFPQPPSGAGGNRMRIILSSAARPG